MARFEGGVLRVGVVESPPWTITRGGEPEGIEPGLVRAFAAEHHARVEWRPGGQSALGEQLEKRELELLIGGIDAKDPLAAKAGATQPYLTIGKQKHIMLVGPGENRLLLALDRFLAGHKSEASRLARDAGQ